MDGGYKGCNPYIERHLAIFVNCFYLERTNQLSLLPDKDGSSVFVMQWTGVIRDGTLI